MLNYRVLGIAMAMPNIAPIGSGNIWVRMDNNKPILNVVSVIKKANTSVVPYKQQGE